MMISEVASESPKILKAEGCGRDHWEGLNCKTATSFALAKAMIGNHSWAMFLDDDTYVHTQNLERELWKRDPSKPIALGHAGCGRGHCHDKRGGFCGGGGYVLSKAALNVLVDKANVKDFRDEFMSRVKEFWPEEDPCDDVVSTCLMKQRGIEILPLMGLYIWRLRDRRMATSFKKLSHLYYSAIHSPSTAPLSFHYITPSEMPLIHMEVLQASRNESTIQPRLLRASPSSLTGALLV